MRLAMITTAALAALTLAACGRDADTTEDAMSAEDAAVEASATTADGGQGGSGAAAAGRASGGSGGTGGSAYGSETVQGSSVSGYGANPQGPIVAGPVDDIDRANAQAEAEQTNLRPRPDVTGPQ